ncbi:MAG: type II secretion system protein [Trueperaceae bacterium]|nr:type II secretion system protein [Trueperaceae bacterium]
MKTHQQGFTLVELMVAIVILAIVALGAAFLQVNALRASNETRITREMREEARSELEAQRRLSPVWRTTVSETSSGCLTIDQGTCTVTLYPCEEVDIGGTDTFVCSSAIAQSALRGHEIVVNYTDRGQTVSVASVAVSQAQP